MKNLIKSASLLLALLLPATATAYDFKVNGIYYNTLNSNEACVTYKTKSYNSYSGNVTIPSTVTYNGATYSVTYINPCAFANCVDLTSVTIPNSVTVIGYRAFYDCGSLRDLFCHIKDPSAISMGTEVFSHNASDYSGRTLHVPHGTLGDYQIEEKWYPYFSRIVEMNPITVLPGDLTGNGVVNIADVNALIDVLLGYSSNTAADVNADGEITIADLNALIDIILSGGAPTPDNHEWVDLGLPSGTLWATCNIGATSPEEYGDYFAWGETRPKSYYSWNNYKWYNNSDNTLTKYCNKSSYGMVDDLTELELEDDAAYVNWGPTWCMPTSEQRKELCTSCTWQWTTRNGVDGYLVTGCNGNSIFLPAAGQLYGGESSSVGSLGYYWTRTLSTSNPDGAYFMYFYKGDWDTWISTSRSNGLTVRAVRMAPTSNQDFYIETRNLNLGNVTVGKTCTGKIIIVNKTNEAVTLIANTDAPLSLQQGDDSVLGMTVRVPGNTRTSVTVMLTPTTTGYVNGKVTFNHPAFDGGQDVVSVYALAVADDTPQQTCVDLGLPSGTLWATCNVGATSPEDYGDYFAWGETEPKESYDWSNYKWCDGSESTLTKYCTNSDYGMVDGKTELVPEDDAAFVNMGPAWRIPSRSQFEELAYNCNWQWTKVNGVNGYLVTGPNGNTLFMPAAGERNGRTATSQGSIGHYWGRSLSSSDSPYFAFSRYFNSSTKAWSGEFRKSGCPVRAVRVTLEDVFIEQQSLNMGGVPIGVTATGQLTIVNCTTEPLTMTATIDEPFLFRLEDGSTSSMTIEVPGNSTATVTVMFTATSPGDYNGNVTFQCPAFDDGQSVIPVHALAFTEPDSQQEWVDLGLPSGTLWATRDIGANSPEENGANFAWGETEPKEHYDWSNYKWCNGSAESLTKYCTDSRYGTVDNKTELEREDDAATINWGPSWRMPSMNQLRELMTSCTVTRVEKNGVILRLVTGPNGNTMYLSAEGWYWSRTAYGSPELAYGMHLQSGDWTWNSFWGPRCSGHRVRAVRVRN